ncbi:MAG: DUF5671 domain-containing protein [Gemmatimonadota bacterium]
MVQRDDLVAFVRSALSRGIPRDRIREALTEAGWSESRIATAMDRFADVTFPVAVPRPRPSTSAREVFEYLLLFGTLYFTAFHLGRLLFQFVDVAFPDPLWPPQRFLAIRDATRWSISALVVFTPVYLFLARSNGRTLEREPIRRAAPVRSWLAYLTLAVAAAILIGDGTALIYNFLKGEMTIRFLLKALIIAGIVGTAFFYYLWDLRQAEKILARAPSGDGEDAARRPPGRTVLAVATAAVTVSVIAGIVLVGTPAEGRIQQLDAARVEDLRSIMNAADRFWKKNERLPSTLDELARDPREAINTLDPGSGEPYEYRKVGENAYELCAAFDRASPESPGRPRADFWRHGAGRHCFALEAKAPDGTP